MVLRLDNSICIKVYHDELASALTPRGCEVFACECIQLDVKKESIARVSNVFFAAHVNIVALTIKRFAFIEGLGT